MRRRLPGWACLLLLALAITACQAATSTSTPVPSATRPALTIYPSWTPTPPPTSTPVPSASFTPLPSPTPTATLSPVPPPYPVYDPQVTLSVDILLDPATVGLHKLIVFTSRALSPFNIPVEDDQGQSTEPRLWAVSPDGRKSGRLTYDDVPFAAYLPASPEEMPIFVAYGVYFNHPGLGSVSLPQECYGWLPDNESSLLDSGSAEACSNFRFSADGKYLAFFFGPTVCGRGMMLLETGAGSVIYRSPAGATFGFEFLSNGKLLRLGGHCEGGVVYLIDPATGEERHLGTAGSLAWNPQHTAFAIAAAPYQGMTGAVWGYSAETDTVFLQEPEVWQLDDHPLWAPDGRHLLFQRRALTINDAWEYSFDLGRQIILVDSQTGARQILAGDGAHDYHLCALSNSQCDPWYGDWLQVRRFPFHPYSNIFTYKSYTNPIFTCLVYGKDCSTQPELLRLNWRTGELLAWDEAALPSPTPVPTPQPTPAPGPNLNSIPIYEDPGGKYAFFVGRDGHSLWLIAADGTSELWVRDGVGFLYLP